VKIVRADASHLKVVVLLFDTYRQFYKQRANPGTARKFLRERLKRDESVIFLAIDGNEAMGFIQLYPSFDSVAMQRIWILYDLFVTPKARRRGVATLLLKRARQLAVDTKAKTLVLETATNNRPAQKLYKELGWKRDVKFYRYLLNL